MSGRGRPARKRRLPAKLLDGEKKRYFVGSETHLEELFNNFTSSTDEKGPSLAKTPTVVHPENFLNQIGESTEINPTNIIIQHDDNLYNQDFCGSAGQQNYQTQPQASAQEFCADTGGEPVTLPTTAQQTEHFYPAQPQVSAQGYCAAAGGEYMAQNITQINTAQTQASAQGFCAAAGGEPTRFRRQNVPELPVFDNTAIPVGAFVPRELKDKIKADIYIDFEKLEKSGIISSDSDSELEFVQDKGVFLKKKIKKTKKVMNIFDWLATFGTFMAVRCDPNTDMFNKLLKHQQTVQSIAKNNGDWKTYDKKFRKLVELGLCKWGQVKEELISAANQKVNLVKKKFSSVNNFVQKPCVHFHKFGACPYNNKCKFSHICPYCLKGQHSEKDCYSKQKFGQRKLKKFSTPYSSFSKK